MWRKNVAETALIGLDIYFSAHYSLKGGEVQVRCYSSRKGNRPPDKAHDDFPRSSYRLFVIAWAA